MSPCPSVFAGKWHRGIVFQAEIAGLTRFSDQNKKGLEHLGSAIAHTDIIRAVR